MTGLQICVGLVSRRTPFHLGSLPTELRSRIEQTLALTRTSEPQLTELQVKAMAMIAWLDVIQGRPQDAEKLLERCVAACDLGAADQRHWRNQPETYTGLPAVVDYAWGVELMLARRDPRAIAVLARAREKFGRTEERGSEIASELFEALAAGLFGSAEQAMSICQRHLERTTDAGAGWAQSWAQIALAITLTKHGDPE